MQRDIKVRFATPEEIPTLADWAYNNQDIPQEDLDALENCQIPMILVVEVNGQPELFLPLLPAVTIAFLGFRPDGDLRNKAIALREMRQALGRFLEGLKIDNAYVFTKAEYPMGKWALKNGFKQKEKDGFTLERTHVQ